MEINFSNLLGADLNSSISLNNLESQKFEVGSPVIVAKVNPVNLSMRDPRSTESIKYWSEEFMNLVTHELTETTVTGVSDISQAPVECMDILDKPDILLYLPDGAYPIYKSGRVYGSGKIFDDIYITNKYPYKEVKWIIIRDNLDELIEMMKDDIMMKQSYFNEKDNRLTQEEIFQMRYSKVILNLNADNIHSDCQWPLRYWNIQRIPIKLGKTDERIFSYNSMRILAQPLDEYPEFYMNVRYDGMINIYDEVPGSLKPKKRLKTGYISRYEEDK